MTDIIEKPSPVPLRPPRRLSGRIPRTGACFRRAGRTTNSRFGRIPTIPTRTASSRTFPAPCGTARASRSRWCAVAGSKESAGPDARRGRDEFVPMSWDAGAGSARRRARARAGRSWPGRGVRRLLRLVQRGPLSPRAEPGPSLPERRDGRLRQVGQHLQLRRLLRPGAAHHRRLRGADEAQRHLGADRRAQRDRGRLRRHGAEEQHGGRRQRQQACRARRHGARGRARLPVRPCQPAARRFARGGRARNGSATFPAPIPR